MAEAAFTSTHVFEIQPVEESGPGEAEWKPVRHHFGIRAFGVNAYVARGEGEEIVPEHTEADTKHEELFFVSNGDVAFTIGEETLEAPSGTLVFVPDPAVKRSAVARSPGTTVLAIGAEPGKPFTPSPWERKRTGE